MVLERHLRRGNAGDAVTAAAGGALAARFRLPLAARPRLGLRAAHAAAAAIGVVAALRLVAAFRLGGPTMLPDEYLYTAISRSLAHGEWLSVRGETLHFSAILASVLTAPAWLLGDVDVAYRVAQAVGVVAMTLAAVPAFLLARRLGLSEHAAGLAAVAAVLVPDAGFGGLLASEPFAYPLFLAAVLAAVDAARAPSARRQLLFLGLWLALCLARVQFFFLPLPYLAAAAAVSRRPGAFLRSQRVTLVGLGLLAGALLAVGGPATLVGRYGGMRHFSHGPLEVAGWGVANVVLVAVAAGWITLPGAVAALVRFLRRDEPVRRAFATLTLLTTAALVGEAAFFGAGLGQLLERYTFYCAPLLVLAFLAAIETSLLSTRRHLALVAALGAGCVLLPLDDVLFTGIRSQSPTMALVDLLARGAGWAAALFAGAALLALTVLAFVLARRGAVRPFLAAAFLLPLAASLAFASALVRDARPSASGAWRVVPATGPASYLAFGAGTDATRLETTLFWNPQIERVLVVDGDAVDTFAALPVRLAADGRLVGRGGAIAGRLVVDGSLTTLDASPVHSRRSGRFAVVDVGEKTRFRSLAYGFPLGGRPLASAGFVAVAAGGRAGRVRERLALRLRDPGSHGWVLRFRCSNGFERRVALGPTVRHVSLPLSGRGVATCGFTVVGGSLSFGNGVLGSVDASARFVRG